MEYRVRRHNTAGRMPSGRLEIISDALIRRFLLRAGFRTSSESAVARTRQHLGEFLEKMVETMYPLVSHGNRMSFRLVDVVNACRIHGIRLYGYDDVCNLEVVSGGIESYHVTEMVESRTTFGGQDAWDDEPDMEPSARLKKTDFVANYNAFHDGGDAEEECDGDDSEWSWYGESDADSDSGAEDEDVEMDSDNNSGSNVEKLWQQQPQNANRFIESLKAAQKLVDEQLLQTDSNGSESDDDAAQGQGYFSDYDEVLEPTISVMQKEAARKEDQHWSLDNNIHEIDEDNAEEVLDAIMSNDDGDQYMIPRQEFAKFFRSTLGNYMQISSVALSALHNVSEQYLHRELTQSVFSYQLQAAILEENAAQESDIQEQLQQEREKVNEQERKIADLTAAFKAKEIEMQHQIAQLQHQLRVRQQSNDDVSMQTPTRTPRKRKSPGKRKLTPTGNSKRIEIVRKDGVKSSTSSKSVVGPLRSKIQKYALRSKKVKANPV